MTIDMLNRATGHEWDDDAICIHCGFDGAEWRHLREEGEPMPMCEVNYWRMAQQEQCATCEHRHYPGDKWCYMFRERPQGVCMKHKPEAQQESPPLAAEKEKQG